MKLYRILEGKLSHGVTDNNKNVLIPKGPKFSQKSLTTIDFNIVNLEGWTTDKKINALVAQVVRNYNEKLRILNAEMEGLRKLRER